jgi:molybdenum cofactor synthesis domain-containing protein
VYLKTLEIICIGNELLIGKTLNTNENWLAGRATALGFKVIRITTVGDEIELIRAAIREALFRKPKFVLITGGLGPTYDDKTLEGVAEALGKPLRIDGEALKMVEAKYASYSKDRGEEKIELTPERVKMTMLPEGAEPLHNRVGTAPGVMLNLPDTCLILLPGVPSEMKAIFEDSVAETMRNVAGVVRFYEESFLVDGIMESSIAPLIEKARHNNPHVYIKSHPKCEERSPHLEIHLSTMAEDAETARKRLGDAKKQLLELISSLR